MEMWGFHIGPYMADLTYEIENRISRSQSAQLDKEANRFIYRILERYNPNSRNANAWIPQGLPLDLIDDNSQLTSLGITDPVKDQVQGFTNKQIFDAITSNTPERMNVFRNNIKSYNSSNWVDTLFSEYKY